VLLPANDNPAQIRDYLTAALPTAASSFCLSARLSRSSAAVSGGDWELCFSKLTQAPRQIETQIAIPDTDCQEKKRCLLARYLDLGKQRGEALERFIRIATLDKHLNPPQKQIGGSIDRLKKQLQTRAA
jgi:hypothetical protein